MLKKAKKILILIVAVAFILFGIVGLVLPVLQGVIFLIIGIVLLSLCFPKIRSFIKHHTEKRPHLAPIVAKIERWIIKVIGEI